MVDHADRILRKKGGYEEMREVTLNLKKDGGWK